MPAVQHDPAGGNPCATPTANAGEFRSRVSPESLMDHAEGAFAELDDAPIEPKTG